MRPAVISAITLTVLQACARVDLMYHNVVKRHKALTV